MIDPFAEFAEALGPVPDGDTGPVGEWLARRGLTAERRWAVRGVAFMRAILTRSTMTFEPHPDGERVLVVPVWAGRAGLEYSDLIDLVAWRPADPATCYLRLGIGTHVGAGGLRQALATASPLRLCRTVEGFVKAGGEAAGEFPAASILNPCFAFTLLRDMPAIICDDLRHGEEVEALLLTQRPQLPPIRIPVQATVAA